MSRMKSFRGAVLIGATPFVDGEGDVFFGGGGGTSTTAGTVTAVAGSVAGSGSAAVIVVIDALGGSGAVVTSIAIAETRTSVANAPAISSGSRQRLVRGTTTVAASRGFTAFLFV